MIKLRELRKAKGLTAKQVANIFGISESAMSMYETGKRQPDYGLLCKMADYFHVSMDTLMGRDTGDTDLSDQELKFALFGDGNYTDAQLEEVKRFAAYVRSRDQK